MITLNLGAVIAFAVSLVIVTIVLTSIVKSIGFRKELERVRKNTADWSRALESQVASMDNKQEQLKAHLKTLERALADAMDLIEEKNTTIEGLQKEADKYKVAKAMVSKLEAKIQDIVGDTAHLMDVAADKMGEVVEKVVPKKKRKYTRKRKPGTKS